MTSYLYKYSYDKSTVNIITSMLSNNPLNRPSFSECLKSLYNETLNFPVLSAHSWHFN